MENNKKQQNFSRPTNSKNSSQTSDSKRKTDLQTSKQAFPRAPRRRDQQPTGPRNDQQRNSKQTPAKQRLYVDKRPRARGGYGGGGSNSGVNSSNSYVAERGASCFAGDDVFAASAGLVDVESTDGSAGDDYDTSIDIGDFDDYSRHTLRMCNVSGKRKNLNHLLNFQVAPREKADYLGGGGIYGVFGSYGTSATTKRPQQQHKYNKEQFLQANFQFVIKSSAKLHLMASPDTIIDWALIEQINIQTTEEPRCPICLYPPVAAKLTRCGHAYCWPCILHYLALNDKSWRKCPICYEAIHVADLKSTAIFQQNQFNLGDEITFKLMRRKKGSFFVERFTSPQIVAAERYPQYSGTSDLKAFSKFLIAKRSDILTIIERERTELLADEDTSCPEYVFVQQALNLLNERREQLGDIQLYNKDEEEQQEEYAEIGRNKEGKSLNTANANNNDFDNIIFENKQQNKNDGQLIEVVDEDNHESKEVLNAIAFDENQHGASASNVSIASSIDTDLQVGGGQQQKYYFFYQSVDGQNIFLHPLNIKMLQACYGTLMHAPLTISARILQKECHTMDEELRRKFTCLGHLPLTCQFAVVEVDLQAPIVNSKIFELFKDDIRQRRMERERRDREEKKREKKIAAINDRQMGKLISHTANINLSSALEFPVCGFDYDLTPSLGAAANATIKKNDVKPVEPTISNCASGTSPGPSYSAVIMSSDASNVNNAGLFPELSMRGKGKKGNASKPLNVGVNFAEFFDPDTGDALKSMRTTFGDVMEQAIVRKKNNHEAATVNTNNASSSGRKQKREKKKMIPLFPLNTSGSMK